MNKIVRILLLLVVTSAFGQTKTPEEFGYRHIVLKYKSDNVDILIKSKRSETIILFLSGKSASTFN
jgi:4-hydroxy-3-methylbut-2-en-1-yl diphosphate synthase IspG/GcpE